MDTTTSTGPRAGLDAAGLLRDLQGLLKKVEDDLHRREQDDPATAEALKDRYAEQARRQRTGLKYADWRDDYLTQVAAGWVLSGVFLRYVEDNGWVDHPWLAGADPQERAWAEGAYEAYFRAHPVHSDRDYLLHVAHEAARLAGLHDLFDPRWNPIWSPVTISGDMAMGLRKFWTEVDPNTGELRRSLADPSGDTRFLGDLYQDLSESARKKFALLQTPEFVADFLLDRTLEPAIDTFGLDRVRMIDPTCGSGHLLLGAFDRLFRRWRSREPGGNAREHVIRALDAVHGVDLNPFAVAIARFRLVHAALRSGEYRTLRDVEGLDEHIHLAVGDSLLGGVRFDRFGRGEGQSFLETAEGAIATDAYATETPRELADILGRQYHAVVGNPPYITPKDPAKNQAYRERYPRTCHRQYSLGVPFTERFFDLALASPEEPALSGFVGMITANGFMKREFGKKLIEVFFPKVDLTHVIDTSGAHIPGHGTPTVILFGRHRRPIGGEVHAVLGIRGEPATPDDAAQGLVWRSIVEHLENGEAENEFITVTTVSRSKFGKHPWSIGGGGVSELKSLIETAAGDRLGGLVETIGRTNVVGEDEVWMLDSATSLRLRLGEFCLKCGVGESIRDWSERELPLVIYPYQNLGGPPVQKDSSLVNLYLWKYRTLLKNRTVFLKTLEQHGRPWYEHLEHYTDKLRWPLAIVFPYKATHNHFVLDRGGKVFKQSAPIIKLPQSSSVDGHLKCLGILNSSLVCFWIKQVFQPGGSSGIGRGVFDEAWEQFYNYPGGGVEEIPIVYSCMETIPLALELDNLARGMVEVSPPELIEQETPTAKRLAANRTETERIQAQMVALQEELDWLCYRLYGLLDEDEPAVGDDGSWARVPGLILGQRPFEIVLARKMAAGEVQTSWFERHGSTPITEVPADWPDWYRNLVALRIELIESNSNIGLIERPEYKRRWQREPWDEQVERALRSWLLDRLESFDYWPDPNHPELMTVAQLADRAGADRNFLQMAALYRDQEAVDVLKLVMELVGLESVPFLPVLIYTESGLRTRAEWRETWRLQRAEDEHRPLLDRHERPLEAIPVPPKYTRKDFQKPDYWRLRDKIDVPKERFVSYPGCERPGDPTLVVAWAGWDHLQQARAIATYFVRLKDEGVPAERLVPLLAGIDELVFWLKLWHNALDPTMGMGLGDYFEDFVATEALAIGYTREQVRAWRPPAPTARGRKKP